MNKTGKRTNFINIQQSHTIACDGYSQPLVRTGYEQLIAQRTNEMFAYSATDSGKVVSKSEKGIIVEYKNGETKGVYLGRQYGNSEGSVYPHDILSPLEVNDKFSKGDVIAYNSGFFEPDVLNPKNVVWKSSLLTKTILLESKQTNEDSCAITPKLSDQLNAKTTKVRSVVLNFKQNIKNILKTGTFVNPKDILCIIEDEITSSTDLFDENTLDSLRKLSNKSPRSKYKGTLDKIEVLYHGDKEDMSSTLRALVNQTDKQLVDAAKAAGKKPHNGYVTSDYRVDGTPLSLDTLEIKFYITIETVSGVGDKVIFANQMKSTIGEIVDYNLQAEDGSDIYAIFGQRSIYARIVNSPTIIGTTNTLLKVVAKKALQIYKGK